MKRALIALICAGLMSVLALSAVGDPKETTDVVKATGTLEPTECIDVVPQVSGALIGLGEEADVAHRVTKETVLARIDPARYEIQLAKAKAGIAKAEAGVRLAKAKFELAKVTLQQAMKKLADEKGSDGSEVEIAKALLNVAEAELVEETAEMAIEKIAVDRAELDLAHCTVHSPIDDGVILARRCDIGQMVSPESNSPAIFLIASDLKKLQLWLNVAERDISKVAVGQPVKFAVEAFPGQIFIGKVAQIRLNASSVENQVFYTVVTNVENPDVKLLPYLTASAEITTARYLSGQ
ncbi:MAG TPA: efflux RND transporter periplasmic adaptor subunit [Pirellulales bacterium]